MKKILMIVSAMMMISGMSGDANALIFSNTTNLDVILGEGPGASWLLEDTYTYTHETPTDFQVPWDRVNSATLDITGYYIDGDDDTVEIQGAGIGTLTPGGAYGISWDWSWSSGLTSDPWFDPSVSKFNIAPTFSSWSTGAPFEVTIRADGDWWDGSLELSSSTFTLDYENQVAPVPEPSTLLLLGAGLLGLTGYRRRRFHTEG